MCVCVCVCACMRVCMFISLPVCFVSLFEVLYTALNDFQYASRQKKFIEVMLFSVGNLRAYLD